MPAPAKDAMANFVAVEDVARLLRRVVIDNANALRGQTMNVNQPMPLLTFLRLVGEVLGRETHCIGTASATKVIGALVRRLARRQDAHRLVALIDTLTSCQTFAIDTLRRWWPTFPEYGLRRGLVGLAEEFRRRGSL